MNEYNVSIRCYYHEGTTHTQHRQTLASNELAKWIEAYRFTHPGCEAITMKIWFDEGGKEKCD